MSRVVNLQSLLIAVSLLEGLALGQTSSYSKTQISSGAFDHEWPSVNNRGDVVWSQRVGGFWQVYLLLSGSTTPIGLPGQLPDHNNQYPAIDDAGDVMYLKDGVGQGVQLAVILNRGGTESIVEFSSRNMLTGQHRDAGKHFGIASNGTTISYFDFGVSSLTTRTFNVSGVGPLPGDFAFADYPDINSSGTFVYSSLGSIYKASVSSPNNAVVVVSGTEPRIADAVSPGLEPEMVYIIAGQVFSSTGGLVDAGSSADLNNSGTVVYEKLVAGFNQVFVATTGSGGIVNVTTNNTAATFTISGPGVTYSGSGTSFVQNNAPVGTYTIHFGPIPGFSVPMAPSQTLTVGQSITFNGVYTAVGQIQVTPLALDFGSTGLGQIKTKRLLIRNIATNNSVLTGSLTLPDGPYSVVGSPEFSIPSGQTRTADVSFRPTIPGTYQQSLRIASNDPTNSSTAISLSGRGEPLTRITVWIKSFIPYESFGPLSLLTLPSINTPLANALPPLEFLYGIGDDRTFSNDRGASYRGFHLVQIDLTTDPITVAEFKDESISHLKVINTGETIPACVPIVSCQPSTAGMQANVHQFGDTVEVNFQDEARSSALIIPNISLDLTFSIDIKARTCRVFGAHDGFPAYEAYLEPNGSPGVQVYGRNAGPLAFWPVLMLQLFPPLDIVVNGNTVPF